VKYLAECEINRQPIGVSKSGKAVGCLVHSIVLIVDGVRFPVNILGGDGEGKPMMYASAEMIREDLTGKELLEAIKAVTVNRASSAEAVDAASIPV
tara:strand:+ start:118 stop:405 length:288 start_codon:yes stop_codon:yes gene_type:complete